MALIIAIFIIEGTGLIPCKAALVGIILLVTAGIFGFILVSVTINNYRLNLKTIVDYDFL